MFFSTIVFILVASGCSPLDYKEKKVTPDDEEVSKKAKPAHYIDGEPAVILEDIDENKKVKEVL